LRIENEELRKDRVDSQFSILDGLAALVDKSLVLREATTDGRSRFAMFETIHEYARDRLAKAGELERSQERHLVYYLAFAESAEQRLSSPDQLVWLDRLAQDHDNFRAALAWALDHGPQAALRLSGALAGFWLTRGYFSEGRAWFERALARAGTLPSPSSAARAKALHGAGRLAHSQDDNEPAAALFAAGLALAREHGEPRQIALLLDSLGELAMHEGDIERATMLCTEGLALARAAGDRSAISHLLLGLGDVARVQGDLCSAASCYEESLALRRALDDQDGIAWALHRLGNLAQAQGAAQRAADLFAEGLALARAVGDQENVAWLLYDTGLLLLEQQDLAGAAERFAESARLLHVLGAGQGVALNLVGLATMMRQRGEPAQAARLLSVAEAQHWVGSSSWWVVADRATYEEAVAAVRTQLDAATFAKAWAEGQSMTSEQAIMAALIV